MTRRRWLGLAVIVWTLAAGVVVLGEVGGPLQVIFGGGFLLVCPGAAAVMLTTGESAIWRVTVVGATSLVVDVLVAEAVLYATGWSFRAAFVVLGWISLAGATTLAITPRVGPVPEPS